MFRWLTGCTIGTWKSYAKKRIVHRMARKSSELRKKMFSAARAESEREFRRIVEEMPLRKLRAARELTQENLRRPSCKAIGGL
jgi:hypothetical protein